MVTQVSSTHQESATASLSAPKPGAAAFGRRQNQGHALRMVGTLLAVEGPNPQIDAEIWMELCRRAATPSLGAAVAGARLSELRDAPYREILLALADCLEHASLLNDRICQLGTQAFGPVEPGPLAEGLNAFHAIVVKRIRYDEPARPLLVRLGREARELSQAARYAAYYPPQVERELSRGA